MDMVTEYFNHTWGYVELAGTIASLICVYLAAKENIWTWFWGAIGVALFGPLFFHYKLYSDAGLQILFFLPMQAIGFYWWKYKVTAGEVLDVKYMSSGFFIGWLFVLVGIASLNGVLMANLTDASFPYADALTTWMSIFAQIFMTRKYVQSWFLWVTMDAIAILIYASKGLLVVSGLYAVFFVLASFGAYAWMKSAKEGKDE